MKNLTTILILGMMLCCAFPSLQAQTTNGKITGTVNDEEGKAIAAATVSLLRSQDSVMVKMAVSGKQGEYEFINLTTGNYIVSVSAVGFNKKISAPVELTVISNIITVPVLQLRPTGTALGEVTVTGKRPLIENKIDRMVVNVDAAPSNAGATAMEVLEKSPGVTVNNDGVISLSGKQGVIVMMDGKPTNLSPADLANVLKNLPASGLDQIEIMTNPPARYDASGNSGIINIKTKKSRNDGLNGSATVGGTLSLFERNDTYYTPVKTNASLNMNYRKNKINLFGNYNFNYREGNGSLEIRRNLFEKDGALNSTTQSATFFNFRNNNHTLKVGLDYYADKKNVFGVVLNGFGFFGRPFPQVVQSIHRPDGSVESILESTTINKNNFYNYSANFNYKHTFDSTGREFTIDLDYNGYNNRSKNLLTTISRDDFNGPAHRSLVLRGNIPSILNIYSVKADYTHPMKKNMRLDAGFKFSYVKNDGEVIYHREYINGNNEPTWIPDSRSNHFIYQENINAGYVSVNKKIKKWSGQLGLRLENTIAKGKQLTNDSSFTRNYTSLFPTAYVSYEANKKHTWTLSYGRRIERPNYQDLNPFTWFLDSLTYRQGNPFLVPQYAHNVELRYMLKGKYTFTINYTNTDDVITQILKQNTAKRTTFLTPDNVAELRNIGLAINSPITWTKWWNSNINVNVFNNRYQGTYYNSFTETVDPSDIDYTGYVLNATNTFTLPKTWVLEVSGFYQGKRVDGLTIADPMYVLVLAAQKTIMKGKGTLRANLRDPFHWQKYSGHTLYSDIDVRINNRWDNRNLTVTFNYRFGKSTVAQARRRTSATNEEQNRAGGSQQ